MYVTDAHSYIWFLTKNQKLSERALSVFQECDRGETTIIIPTIVLLEIMYICEKYKTQDLFTKMLNNIQDSLNYIIYPLDMNIVSRCQKLNILKDMHDRIIVATSNILKTKLITKDEKITESGLADTFW